MAAEPRGAIAGPVAAIFAGLGSGVTAAGVVGALVGAGMSEYRAPSSPRGVASRRQTTALLDAPTRHTTALFSGLVPPDDHAALGIGMRTAWSLLILSSLVPHAKDAIMLELAVVLLVIALIAGLLGFTGIAGTSVVMAKWVFVIFLIFAIIAFLF